MSLWNKTDNLAGAPKFIARKAWFNAASTDVVSATNDTINLVPSNTGFNTGDEVMYSINGGTVITGLTDATAYFVRVVGSGVIELYATYAQAIAAPATTGRVAITAVGAGVHTLQRTGKENPFIGESGIYFADRGEAQLEGNKKKGIKYPGWWLYKTYTDANSVVRHKAECLIALDVVAGTSGDAEDALLKDVYVYVVGQPQDVYSLATDTATFSVDSAIEPSTGTLLYQWQVSTDGTTFVNVSNGTGGTTAEYTTVAVTSGMDGYLYRCVVSAAGATSVTSEPAELVVVAITITSDSADTTVAAGSPASFSVEASVAPVGEDLTYQWETSIDSGTTWGEIAGETEDTLTIATTTAEMSGLQYRCVLSAYGVSVTSTVATLTVTA